MPALVSAAKSLLARFGVEVRRFRPGPGTGGPRHSNFGEQEILARLAREIPGLNRFCVDIGAGDGAMHSNSLALFEAGWQGAAVEMDGDRFGRMAWRHRNRPGLRLARTRVTPLNVVSLLRGLEVPEDFGLLSLDIDGYDYFVLEALLAPYSPSVLCVEINEKVPPPLRFAALWREDYAWDGGHCYGQSLSMAQELCAARGYALVALEYNNAFFARRDRNPWPELDAETAYRRGYRDRPDRLRRLPWNKNMEDLLALPPAEAAETLRRRWAVYSGRIFLEA